MVEYGTGQVFPWDIGYVPRNREGFVMTSGLIDTVIAAGVVGSTLWLLLLLVRVWGWRKKVSKGLLFALPVWMFLTNLYLLSRFVLFVHVEHGMRSAPPENLGALLGSIAFETKLQILGVFGAYAEETREVVNRIFLLPICMAVLADLIGVIFPLFAFRRRSVVTGLHEYKLLWFSLILSCLFLIFWACFFLIPLHEAANARTIFGFSH